MGTTPAAENGRAATVCERESTTNVPVTIKYILQAYYGRPSSIEQCSKFKSLSRSRKFSNQISTFTGSAVLSSPRARRPLHVLSRACDTASSRHACPSARRCSTPRQLSSAKRQLLKTRREPPQRRAARAVGMSPRRLRDAAIRIRSGGNT